MKYKIVALILIIPIILMLCVFSSANLATLKVPIAVSSVNVFHQTQEKVNLAESNTFQINAQVMPVNASNKGLLYSYESVNGKSCPTLDIDENGLVTASGYGIAKIIVTTKDGAYKKSFLLEVTSTKADMIVLSLSKTGLITIGDHFKVNCTIFPNEVLDKNVIFSSSNSNIIRINQLTGECVAISSGRVILKATHENGLNGKIEEEIEVVVLPNTTGSPITFDGMQSLNETIFTNNFEAIMEINFSSYYGLGFELNKEDILLEYQNESVDNVELELIESSGGIYKYKVTITGLISNNFTLRASLTHENLKNYHSEINLEKVVDLTDIKINVVNWKDYVKLSSVNDSFSIEVLPKDFTGYTASVSFKNDNITVTEKDGIYSMKYSAVGKNTLNVDVLYDGEKLKSFEKDIEVLNPPSGEIELVEGQYENFGEEELFTIGSQKIENAEYVENRYTPMFTTSDIDLNYIKFESSNHNVAMFENGKLKVVGEGTITITATELQSEYFDETRTCSAKIRVVDGVMVETYEELIRATEDSKVVVLINNIDLGEKLIEVGLDGATTQLKSDVECAEILSSELKQIETSSEWMYYKNTTGSTTPPLLNYIIKFTNDCYGNGFELNANNITNLIDGSSTLSNTYSLYPFAKFKGPLDLVAIPNASVKAQDNICFIASDNVTINNVELVGANLRGSDSNDLNGLNHVGTVLEVMGDNVKIVNSRIRNGRNCVRVFGKESGNYDKINVLIEGCYISTAREFLVKMGTNAKIYGEFKERDSIDLSKGLANDNPIWEECAPKINNYTHLNDEKLSNEEYSQLVAQYNNDEEFLKLVKTNLTIKNCTLRTSGLFSIGLESSFAGPALDGGMYGSKWDFGELGWGGIAGTSYPTMLNLEGIVKLYDWKNISHIDSSTLIEGNMFNFDLSGLVDDLYTNKGYTKIVTETPDGQKYSHGGIVMYGGGKNYALINNKLDEGGDFENFTLSLDSLNTTLTSLLKYASGKEPFRVLMYGKNSAYNYNKQDADVQSGEADKIPAKYIF